MPMSPIRTLIMGAAGRDFHNFNVYYRDNEQVEVVAFTATQIPGIDGRRYHPEHAGSHYPEGIQIHEESELLALIDEHGVEAHVDPASERLGDALDELVWALGGTISAEHGIGRALVDRIGVQKTAVEREIARAVKHLLDPDGRFNPGKVFG